MNRGNFIAVLLAGLISLSLLEAQAISPVARPRTPGVSPRPATTRTAVTVRTPAVRVRAHGVPISGRVSGLDPGKKILSVRDAAGRETSLVWTSATKISGGDLKIGESVMLRYLDKDTRHIAMTIRIAAPPSPSLTAGAAVR